MGRVYATWLFRTREEADKAKTWMLDADSPLPVSWSVEDVDGNEVDSDMEGWGVSDDDARLEVGPEIDGGLWHLKYSCAAARSMGATLRVVAEESEVDIDLLRPCYSPADISEGGFTTVRPELELDDGGEAYEWGDTFVWPFEHEDEPSIVCTVCESTFEHTRAWWRCPNRCNGLARDSEAPAERAIPADEYKVRR